MIPLIGISTPSVCCLFFLWFHFGDSIDRDINTLCYFFVCVCGFILVIPLIGTPSGVDLWKCSCKGQRSKWGLKIVERTRLDVRETAWFSRATSPILSKDLSFQQTIKNPGETAGF